MAWICKQTRRGPSNTRVYIFNYLPIFDVFLLTLSQTTKKDSSKFKEFADGNFKSDEMAESSSMGRKQCGKRRNCS